MKSNEWKRNHSRRDTGIELARIIGCLIVVGVHTCLGIMVDNHYDLTRTYIACVFADGVAVFWLISGSFLFRNTSYKKLVKKSISTFVLPLVIYSLFSFYFSGWLIKGENLIQSIMHTKDEYVEVLKKLLSWRNFAEYGGHLWYLYVYLLMIVIYPVLKSFVDYLDEEEARVRTFLLISFALLVLNDISQNQFGEFNHYTFRGVVPASIEVIWGHILYKNKEKFHDKKYIAGGITLFGMLNVLRLVIQVNRTDNNAILYWYSSIGLICAICVIVFSLAFVDNIIRSPRIKNGINVFATYTFSIYMIHPLVKEFFRRYGIQKRMMQYMLGMSNSWYLEILYTVIILITVFVCTLIIALIIRKCVELFWGIMNHIKGISEMRG